MLSILHYMSAKRRLKEANKTVYMMGGVDECPPMVLAQRDMIELEVNYYAEETKFWVVLTTIIVVVTSIYLLIYFLKGLYVG